MPFDLVTQIVPLSCQASPRVGVAIGQEIVDMAVIQESGLLSDISGLQNGVFEQVCISLHGFYFFRRCRVC